MSGEFTPNKPIDEHEFFDKYRAVPLEKNGMPFTLEKALQARAVFCPPTPEELPEDRINWMAKTLFENGALLPEDLHLAPVPDLG